MDSGDWVIVVFLGLNAITIGSQLERLSFKTAALVFAVFFFGLTLGANIKKIQLQSAKGSHGNK